MKLITVKTFDTAFDAHLVRSKLESEGIECFIHDEHTVSTNPLFSNTVGGIKLKIEETNQEQAYKVISELNTSQITDESGEVITCPSCDSDKIMANFNSMKSIKGILSMIIALLFSVLPLHLNKVYRCKNCNHEFKE